ncbi:hypothetical protein NQ315_001781 [Exocentrus adspersus]|uniref:Sperm flagellar protein 2 n=1 Tax=Exocentrus adspersus TaxID=1586481 RepID=A0AAV8WAF7_9CUCU|nr:hypothetical protein NQ315_001781 [Exocentrus adspersus]
MTNIVQKWIQDRLGVVVSASPKEFANSVKDGYLLCRILRHHEIITEEQLDTIEESHSPEICLLNFKNRILIWLKPLDIQVNDEELFQIVNGEGTAALNLFYQLYFELHNKTTLYFITEQRLRERVRPESRFKVMKVEELNKSLMVDSSCKKYDSPLREAKDIIHWQVDKLQMLQAKCKEAREHYLQFVRSREPAIPRMGYASAVSDFQKSKAMKSEQINDEEVESINLSYEELLEQQEQAKTAPAFEPDSQVSKKIIKKLRLKHKQYAESLIFKKDLAYDLFTSFTDQVKDDEETRINQNVVDAIAKRSLYERQMHQKVEEVKMQKKNMLENKSQELNEISKQMEVDFVQRLVEKDKDLEEKELIYYMEKERLTELHRKLYDRKLYIKRERIKKICKETSKDLVDLACNISDYTTQVGEDPPRRVRDAWKEMFIAGIPFNDYVTPTETILKPPEELPEEVEEIVHLEIDRQERMDEKDFESYQTYEWPWSLENIDMENYDMHVVSCAMNVLGNLVHNLLIVKYPFPSVPPKPDFPNISILACVNGLDTIHSPVLQEILDLRNVLVVQMQDCINFCTNAFIEESKREIEDTEMAMENAGNEKSNEHGKDKNKEKRTKKKTKGEKSKAKGGNNKEEQGQVTSDPRFLDKMVQTPKYYPDEDISLTSRAELGRVAQEVLQAGEALTSHIVVAMFIEYLKSKPDIKGWVLINYPQTYEEAAVLEESLTGQPVLGRNQFDHVLSIFDMAPEMEEKPCKSKTYEFDEYHESRLSRILPQPVAPIKPEFYDTALTAYIKAIKKGGDRDKRNRESINTTVVEEFEEITDPLDKFYADLGCCYYFYFNRIDFTAMKHLAKLVIGDYTLPPKSSVEIFGEQVKYLRQERDAVVRNAVSVAKIGEKKLKPKKLGMLSKSKTDAISRDDKVEKLTEKSKSKLSVKGEREGDNESETIVIVHVSTGTQAPEVEEEEPETDLDEPIRVENSSLPNPGEEGWPYLNLPFPREFQIAMATLWENAEDVYIVDMQQVFFLKRLFLNAVMPFVYAVKNHMFGYMNRPDEKQKHLREFQKMYNEFEDDFRADDDFKVEMHCRINELKEKLMEICDWKMIAADHERVLIINKNWTSRQLIQFVNNYITAFQLELDRFADTMTLINDYYAAVVTKIPSDMVVSKEPLPKLEAKDSNIITQINNLLQHVDDTQEVALHKFVEGTIKKCLQFVETAQIAAQNATKTIRDICGIETGTTDSKSIKNLKQRKVEKGSGKRLPSGGEVDETVLGKCLEIIGEWDCVIQGEVMRVKMRFDLLKNDLFRNLDEVLAIIRKTFHVIYQEIHSSYKTELDTINNVCGILALAVEREVKLQEELVLDKLQFYVDPEVILFPDKLPTVRPLAESIRTGVFTIKQLELLVDILSDLSPAGYMPERSFSFLLQDLVVSREEPILVPELWRQLQPRQVDRVSKSFFDELEYVQWKDFILYNLVVPFPTATEILELRNAFRKLDPDTIELVYDYQCLEIEFWFESTEDDKYRLKLMRKLIFRMYSVRTDQINYTALLLDFCKDVDAVVGLAKALGVCLGKVVCWEKEKGERFMEMSRRRKLNEEILVGRKQNAESGTDAVKRILAKLLDRVESMLKKHENGIYDEEVDGCNEEDNSGQVSSVEISLTSTQTESLVEVEPVPDLAYFLPSEVLVTVITACLPWHAKIQNIEDESLREKAEKIFEECKNEEFDHKVLCHEFLNHPTFVELIKKTRKFTVINPVLVVEEILQEKEKEPIQRKGKKN